jgi:hypothetical protein
MQLAIEVAVEPPEEVDWMLFTFGHACAFIAPGQ